MNKYELGFNYLLITAMVVASIQIASIVSAPVFITVALVAGFISATLVTYGFLDS